MRGFDRQKESELMEEDKTKGKKQQMYLHITIIH